MCTLDEIKKEPASKNNVELIQSLVDLSERERTTSADILLHLIEVEQRKLHLEYGYSSLFSTPVRNYIIPNQQHTAAPAQHAALSVSQNCTPCCLLERFH